jgi:predicted enzyme related to lactoylglutathione lyase
MTKRRLISAGKCLWPAPVVLVAFAAGRVGIALAAAQQTAPGAAACTALAAPLFTAVATLTTIYDAGSAGQPAHCVVRGSAAPRTGVDGKAYETRFELRLPTDWSGRFLYQGGGGNDGIVAPAVGRNTGSFPDTGLQRGFAVVTTDAGHQGGSAEFGLDPQARIDHAYAAHERTATIAFAIVSRYYGRAPERKYFVGCSGGGRQGMMFAQRYPSYFDGIAMCAPAMSVSSGATIAAAWDTQTYLSIAPLNEQGQRVLSRAFSDADLALVARGITTACDGADGATDGMVLRPEACRFDPNRLKCEAAKRPDCLTSDQVAALQKTFGGPRDSSGRALYVGQPWDPGIATAGWRQWKLGTSPTSTPNAINSTLMAGALAHEFVTPPDPSFAITQFDFDRDPKRMEAFSAVYDTYRDATLAEFRKRGGKLLIFHGTADPIFSALESVDYYQRLTRNNGGADATASWARLFLVPGMNHCAGGPATDSFDGLGAIVNWVEKGTAPARIEASARPGTTYFAGRTRPLCPYPSAARYTGKGNLEDGANFECAVEPAARGLYNWIHSTGDAERSFAFYRDVFGIELTRSPFAGAASASARPETIRPAAQAGSDPLVWDLTGTHGSRFRTVFMRAPNTPFGLELSEFFDVPRGERAANPWDPGASKIVFGVRDLDVIVGRLKSRRAPVVSLGGAAIDTAQGRAILVRDPDGYLVEARQASAAALSAAKDHADVIETSIWISVARLDRALAFYEGLLGFNVRNTRTADTAELRVNGLTDVRLTQTETSVPGIGATVILAEFTLPATSTRRAAPFEWRVQDVGAPQFQLEVTGLDALLERTKRAGYRFVSAGATPIQRPFGRFVFVIDSDGILVEFVEPAVRAR